MRNHKEVEERFKEQKRGEKVKQASIIEIGRLGKVRRRGRSQYGGKIAKKYWDQAGEKSKNSKSKRDQG